MRTLDLYRRLAVMPGITFLALLSVARSEAFPLEHIVFYQDPEFAGISGVHSITSSNMDSLVTVAAWADTGATVPANIFQYFWLIGVDSGVGNGALIDGSESMTLGFDNSVGAANITFFYTGGDGGT